MKRVILSAEELEIIRQHAKKAELGGKSHIRSNRAGTIKQDQLTGQLGEAALSKLISGSISAYHQIRLEKEKNPWKGDNGFDFPGLRVDVKTSRMKAGRTHLYNLWVREREYHADVIYYLALVPVETDHIVYFVGWVEGRYLSHPVGLGRYEIRMDHLNPMEAGE